MAQLTALISGVNRLLYPGINYIAESVLLADVNAGKNIIDNNGAYILRVMDGYMVARGGAMGALTLARVVTDEGTPVVIFTGAQANLTEDNFLEPGVTGFARGAGWKADLAAGAGIDVDKTGSAGTTATELEVGVAYQILNGLSPREAPALAVI